MTNLPKKIVYNYAPVSISEMAIDAVKKINELIEYLQEEAVANPFFCNTCDRWVSPLDNQHKCTLVTLEEASKEKCKHLETARELSSSENEHWYCIKCGESVNPPEHEEREQWQCDLAILMGKLVGPRDVGFDDPLEDFIKERLVSKEKIKRAIEVELEELRGTTACTFYDFADDLKESLGLGD